MILSGFYKPQVMLFFRIREDNSLCFGVLLNIMLNISYISFKPSDHFCMRWAICSTFLLCFVLFGLFKANLSYCYMYENFGSCVFHNNFSVISQM